MDIEKTLALSLSDIYQFLISDCRYGYRRNNHLMPNCAYEKVGRIIPQMYEVDADYTIVTIKQLCEECISDELVANFGDGEDDENGNRMAAINFINWCVNWVHLHEVDERFGNTIWFPSNYNLFEANIAKDEEPRYRIYELNGEEKTLLTKEPLSNNKYMDAVFERIDVITGECNMGGSYSLDIIKFNEKDPSDKRRHYIVHIEEPIKKDFYVEHI